MDVQQLRNAVVLTLLTFFILGTATWMIEQPQSGSNQSFVGTGQGYWSEVTVEVTVENSNISDIQLIVTEDTPELFTPAFEQIVAEIIHTQSLEAVETVSGATESSKGILEAVNNALETRKQPSID